MPPSDCPRESEREWNGVPPGKETQERGSQRAHFLRLNKVPARMRQPWPKAWNNTAHCDRINEHGEIVSSVTLRDSSGRQRQAEAGDFVRLRKDGRTIGVIDRITPSRVRVLVGEKRGNYMEESLIFHGKARNPQQESIQGRTVRADGPSASHMSARPHRNAHEQTFQNTQTAAAVKEDTTTEDRSNEDIIAFFKELEDKMVQYTHAAVELFIMMEQAKTKFTQDPGRYPDNTSRMQEEFKNEALQRVSDFQLFIDRMEARYRTSERS